MLDNFDRKILKYLQIKGDATNAELGEEIGISASQAGRRKARLEGDGVISGYRARIQKAAVNLNIQAFIQLSLNTHSKSNAEILHSFLMTQENIVNIWTMTGRADYLLQVFCRDLNELNHLVHDVLLSHENIAHVESQIVMNHLKSDGHLPVR
ncbi:Lrp/AsnC family transcriptional regulator [Kiloniella sp. b19]|uniref:Lrp/AsnC family transcriptional regulator n=1 Tax=Kiloniella sp. GXU_MW_B19 TaxID=3141326 RepID=UPI0031D77100